MKKRIGKHSDLPPEKTAIGTSNLTLEHFLQLSNSDMRAMVSNHFPHLSCVCLADGYRRIVRMETGLNPDSEEFCRQYARLFCQSLQKSLAILFNNGVKTLYFPLFGPSLLKRGPMFKAVAIPAIYLEIFISAAFQEFYRHLNVRILAYGDIERVDDIDIKNLHMKQGIQDCIKKSASNPYSRTLYFGFMSSHTPTESLFPHIISFHQTHNRPPTLKDVQTHYYSAPQSPAHIIISSKNPPPLNALPPYLDLDNAVPYSFVTPFDMAFSQQTFRRILFHRLFTNPTHAKNDYSPQDLQIIDNLKDYYQQNRHTIITPGNSHVGIKRNNKIIE